jgi:hypothetical protein
MNFPCLDPKMAQTSSRWKKGDAQVVQADFQHSKAASGSDDGIYCNLVMTICTALG